MKGDLRNAKGLNLVSGVGLRTIALVLFIATLALPSAAIEKGEQLPEFLLASAAGTQEGFSLEQYKGKVVLLDIWASWCSPCRYSMPWLSELQEKYGQDRFQVVTINVDEDKSDAMDIVASMSEKVVVEYDPEGRIPEMLNVQGMPTSFLIDASGNVISVKSGFRDSDKEYIENLIKSLLQNKAA